MSRERSFSEPKVLSQIADVFSVHGFANTSLSQLQDATGLGKQSLYNSFGDKAAMYQQAVDCAVARFASVVPLMLAASTGRVALRIFFDHLLRNCLSGEASRQRCIVTSGLLEDIEDTSLRAQLCQKWQSTHELLRSQVERGQRDGSIASSAPTAELADQLMMAVSGLRVMARIPTDAKRMSRCTAMALACLDINRVDLP